MTTEKFEIEINTLKTFLELYCKDKHEHQETKNVTLNYDSKSFVLELNLCLLFLSFLQFRRTLVKNSKSLLVS